MATIVSRRNEFQARFGCSHVLYVPFCYCGMSRRIISGINKVMTRNLLEDELILKKRGTGRTNKKKQAQAKKRLQKKASKSKRKSAALM